MALPTLSKQKDCAAAVICGTCHCSPRCRGASSCPGARCAPRRPPLTAPPGPPRAAAGRPPPPPVRGARRPGARSRSTRPAMRARQPGRGLGPSNFFLPISQPSAGKPDTQPQIRRLALPLICSIIQPNAYPCSTEPQLARFCACFRGIKKAEFRAPLMSYFRLYLIWGDCGINETISHSTSATLPRKTPRVTRRAIRFLHDKRISRLGLRPRIGYANMSRGDSRRD